MKEISCTSVDSCVKRDISVGLGSGQCHLSQGRRCIQRHPRLGGTGRNNQASERDTTTKFKHPLQADEIEQSIVNNRSSEHIKAIAWITFVRRALDHDHLMRLQSRVEGMSVSVASGYGCNATVSWRLNEQPLYPPTVNDAASVQFTKEVAAG